MFPARPSGGAHGVAWPPDGRGDQRPVRARQEEPPAGAHRLHVGPHRDAARARHRVRPGARRGGESLRPRRPVWLWMAEEITRTQLDLCDQRS